MPARRLFAGASGYSYKEWYGTFYPDKMKPDEMLAWYSERLPAVEINNTFYRMPRPRCCGTGPPPRPSISVSLSRRHAGSRTSRDSRRGRARFCPIPLRQLSALGAKRGPVLFQLPPNLKKDLPRLTAFLQTLPADHGAAFEFRNEPGSTTRTTTRCEARERRCACQSARTICRRHW